MRHIVLPALLLWCTLCTQAALAQTTCTAPSPDCVVVGEWDISVGFGLGGRTNPVKTHSDIPFIVVPQISYYGKRFFLDNLELGYTLHESDSHTINLLATPGYDRVFFIRGDLQNIFVGGLGTVGFPAVEPIEDVPLTQLFPLEPRRTTYLVGPEWIFNYGPIVGQVDALYEATGRHKGYEVRSAIAASVWQGKGSLVASAGLTWKSAELVRYYYGVERFYEPGSALNPFVKLGYSLPLSPRWTFNAFAHYEYLDDAIADSPIIGDHGVASAFAGVVFKLL